MMPVVVTIGSLVLMSVAVIVGMILRGALPKQHASAELNETTMRAQNLVVTLTALVLGFMVSSAKSHYDGVQDELTRMAADAILLDRTLVRYGPEAGDARQLLRQTIGTAVRILWPDYATRIPGLKGGLPVDGLEQLENSIRSMPVRDDVQRSLQTRALQTTADIVKTSPLLVTASRIGVQAPILVILASWLVIIFVSFGLLAPQNGSAIAVQFMSAVAASGAIFLILELYDPIGGLIQIPPSTLEIAIKGNGG